MPWRSNSSRLVGHMQKPSETSNGLQWLHAQSRLGQPVTRVLGSTALKISQTPSISPDRQWKLLLQVVRFKISSLIAYFIGVPKISPSAIAKGPAHVKHCPTKKSQAKIVQIHNLIDKATIILQVTPTMCHHFTGTG